ncbi:uncharacterized protein rbbp8l isoform X1 [Erpetoichthys calabaricus]|uniref:uncharacterized protein rbbp8l isoform X1 n=1 Tax=Erpetoichthys calabaricus TaxID=27687 RepID=UPI0010A07AFB|nr:uncharacterized protein rbbp8l isoform X1 [Erpetoichthys calabaricus]
MTSDSFSELLNRLREIHEKETKVLQAKVTELTMEKCCDAQRMEEMFSKNQQLREQQKILQENVKLLENRLRAGLCDRCTVTQDAAKKRQQEFENSQLQSLHHISMLVNEMNMLKKENKRLLEEVKKLRGAFLERNGRYPKAPTPEFGTSTDTTATLSFVAAMNKSSQMLDGRLVRPSVHKASEQSSPQHLAEGTVGIPEHRKVLSWSGQESQNLHMISNQLHSTIAVMTPGAKNERSSRMSPGVENIHDSKPGFKGSMMRDMHEDMSQPFVRAKPSTEERIPSPLVTFRTLSERAQRLSLQWASENKMDWGSHIQERSEDHIPVADCYGHVIYMKEQTLETHNEVQIAKEKCLQQDGDVNVTYKQVSRSLNRNSVEDHKKATEVEIIQDRSTHLQSNGTDSKHDKAYALCKKTNDSPLDLSDYGRSKEGYQPNKPEEEDRSESFRLRMGSDEMHGYTNRGTKRSRSDSSSSIPNELSPTSSQSVKSQMSPVEDKTLKESALNNKERNIQKNPVNNKATLCEQENIGSVLMPVVVLEALRDESEAVDSSDSEMAAPYDSESNHETSPEDPLSSDGRDSRNKGRQRIRLRKMAVLRRHSPRERKAPVKASSVHQKNINDPEKS